MKPETHWRGLWRLLLVMLLVMPSVPGSVEAQEPPPFVETTLPWPEDIHQAVSVALFDRPSDFLPGVFESLILTSLDFYDDGQTVMATVVMRPDPMPEYYEDLLMFPASLVLLKKEKERWVVYLENTEAFQQQVASTIVFAEEFESSFFSPLYVQDISDLDLQWPWQDKIEWYYIQGRHEHIPGDGTKSALDFASRKTGEKENYTVKVAGDGFVWRKCDDGVQTNLYIDHGSEYSIGYSHLDSDSEVKYLKAGDPLLQGADIGYVYGYEDDSEFPKNTTCGYTTGPHLHFNLFKDETVTNIKGIKLSGWQLSDGDCFVKDKDKYCVGAWIKADNSQNPPPPCPIDGGVILYYDKNYGCGSMGSGDGYFQKSNTGRHNLPEEIKNDGSSIRIPANWSVMLYEDLDFKGSQICRSSSDSDFSGDTYTDGTELDNSVSSLEIFDTPNCSCGGSAPYTPILQSPEDGYVTSDQLAPTLRISSGGDPDGDTVQFYFDVYGTGSANSGWIDNTSWRPSSLDNRYGDYQWRVKARDRCGMESGWSEIWSFTISPPNEPPEIDFQTANGQNFGDTLFTRVQDWTFCGESTDPEGELDHTEFKCKDCDDDGSGDDEDNDSHWCMTRTGMSGKNTVYFKAYDDAGNKRESRKLTLYTDLAAPTTQASLNGSVGPWPVWFTQPVALQLTATDGATGNARVGVKEVHYRVDGGAWQTQQGDRINLTVSNDGQHIVEYYAVDQVGNTEATRNVTFQIDQTPPSPPTGIVETHGVSSNLWQRAINAPTFTWAESTDAGSGLKEYRLYFGPDAQGTNYLTFAAGQPRTWTPQPAGVATGVYYLRGQTVDHAGNTSAWVDLFTFKYDGTPPENPGVVTHTAGISSTVWQRITSAGDFIWPTPHDEGSGVKGYYTYWGFDPEGTSSAFTTANTFQGAPLCAVDDTCVSYFRLRTADNVDNLANEWSTGFVIRYDNTPPTPTLGFYGGITMTNQTQVLLSIACDDGIGSGCKEMQFSTNGVNWLPWEVYTTTRVWTIPDISRRSWPVFVRVRDGVGLESEVDTSSIYLDTSWRQPRSANFWLLDEAQSSGAGAATSTNYATHSTVAQIADSSYVSSTNYILNWGYEAGSQALPLVIPGYDTYTFINGAFASGNSGTPATSTSYQMIGVIGEIGVPVFTTTLSSSRFQHQPGFLPAPEKLSDWSAMQLLMPPAPEEPPLVCEYPFVQINDGSGFTDQLTVILTLCAPKAVTMTLSNDSAFAVAITESYTLSRTWTLPVTSSSSMPQFVYARFINDQGAIYETYFDEVIYDISIPTLTLRVEATAPGMLTSQTVNNAAMLTSGVPLRVQVYDDHTGVAAMQFSDNPAFTGALWEPYAPVKWYTPPSGEEGEHTVYVRVRDQASNISPAAQATFVYDALPPEGGIAFSRWAVAPDTLTTTVYFGAWDQASDVTAMRVSDTPNFTDAAWQPYTDMLELPLSTGITWGYSGTLLIQLPMTVPTQYTRYAQYRDAFGHISEIYSDTLHVDSEPPVVYVDIAPGNTLTRTTTFYAYDDWSDVEALYISNDPLMETNVVTFTDAFTTTTWVFDANHILWARAVDTLGNLSEPYPAYAWESAIETHWVFLPLVLRQ